MSDFMNDIASEAASVASEMQDESTLETVKKLGARVNAINLKLDEIKHLETDLNKEKNEILGRRLVDIMSEIGIEDFSVDGKTFIAGSYYKASIPEEHRDEAHDLLEGTFEAGDLIKYQLIVEFPKDSEEEVKKVEAAIRTTSNIASIEKKRSVPWKRLTSWLKEYYESTRVKDPTLPPVPLETFGATVGRVVRIKDK